MTLCPLLSVIHFQLPSEGRGEGEGGAGTVTRQGSWHHFLQTLEPLVNQLHPTESAATNRPPHHLKRITLQPEMTGPRNMVRVGGAGYMLLAVYREEKVYNSPTLAAPQKLKDTAQNNKQHTHTHTHTQAQSFPSVMWT